MVIKIDLEKLKKEISEMGEDDKQKVRDLLGKKEGDKDLIDEVLTLTNRVSELEKVLTKKPVEKKEKGFFSFLTDNE